MTLHRIVNPLADQSLLNKYPVLYGHGVLYDSQSMISRSEHSKPRKPVLGKPTIKYPDPIDDSDDYSFPFMLSNNNFDVWLYDARGVNNENRNISATIDPSQSKKFWDFSLDDQALDDLPRLMDFVLTQTGSEKLVYVGYSESTWFMFALLSTRPEYSKKVAAFVAMAPVAYVSNIKGMTLPLLASMGGITPEFVHTSFLPMPVIETVDLSLKTLCAPGISKLFCSPVVNSIGGQGSGEMAPDFFVQFFKSTSLKAFKHFFQLYMSKRFAMYDYGHQGNINFYGSPRSPDYDLNKVTSDRIILVRGLSDFLSDPTDQLRIVRELGTKPYLDIVIPEYNHFDFIDGKNLTKRVNEPALLAIYELMYKDGPNVLKSPAQFQITETNRLLYERQSVEGVDTDAPARRVARPPETLGLFGFQRDFVQNLLG